METRFSFSSTPYTRFRGLASIALTGSLSFLPVSDISSSLSCGCSVSSFHALSNVLLVPYSGSSVSYPAVHYIHSTMHGLLSFPVAGETEGGVAGTMLVATLLISSHLLPLVLLLPILTRYSILKAR